MKHLIILTLVHLCSQIAYGQSAKIPTAINQFAISVYQTEARKPGNIFFSPLSLEVGLSMAALAAEGETKQQILKTLRIEGDYQKGFKSLLRSLNASKDYHLISATRLWTPVIGEYNAGLTKILKEFYNSEIYPVDFKAPGDAPRSLINDWVKKQTKENVQEVVPVGALSPETSLLLTSTLYFKGNWAMSFPPDVTKVDEFFIDPKKSVQVPFMRLQTKFLYARNSQVEIVQIPYTGGELVMEILVPSGKVKLEKIEARLTPKYLERLRDAMTNEEVDVVLPKFKVESSFELSQNLAALGMPRAFERDRASFSGIPKAEGGHHLFLTKVLHKAVIEVEEQGTETALASRPVFAVRTRPTVAEAELFQANRPFLFFIRHAKTDAIVFMGRFLGP